jgi:hypothetical protein
MHRPSKFNNETPQQQAATQHTAATGAGLINPIHLLFVGLIRPNQGRFHPQMSATCTPHIYIYLTHSGVQVVNPKQQTELQPPM